MFLVVALNSNWKVLVRYYFLTNSFTAQEKANLVITCLQNLNDVGSIIQILSFDEATSNISMAKYLRVDLSSNNIKSTFQHPSTLENVHVFLNAAHMLKLVYNTLGDWHILKNQNNSLIYWKLFINLVNFKGMETYIWQPN